MNLKVTLWVNSQDALDIDALLDSGATGNYIDQEYAMKIGIVCEKKERPELVKAVDGTVLSSGPVSYHTRSLLMQRSQNHQEHIQFDLIDAPQFRLILGMPWLTLHDPKVSWAARTITLSSDYCKENCSQEMPCSNVIRKTPSVCLATECSSEHYFVCHHPS